MNKKKLFATAVAVCMIAILSFSTLAWFSDSEEVTNKFEVVTSDDESADDIFSVDVYEDVDTDGDGVTEKVEEGGATFEDVVPGDALVKAPYVQNTGRYDQWVRLTITFDSAEAWLAISNGVQDGPLALLTFADDFDANWVGERFEAVDGKLVYTYYLKNVLAPDAVVATFTQVNIPNTLTQEDLFGVKGENLQITVLAEAVQVDNVGAASAEEAFAIVEGTTAP